MSKSHNPGWCKNLLHKQEKQPYDNCRRQRWSNKMSVKTKRDTRDFLTGCLRGKECMSNEDLNK